MTTKMSLVVFATLILCKIATAQCPKAEMLTEWDDKSDDFKCVSPGGESLPIDHSFPGKTFESDGSHKEFCDVVLANELKACPSGTSGESCRKRADANNGRCMDKGSGGGSEKAGTATRDSQPKPTVASCKETYNQQVKACKSRQHTIPTTGGPPAQDICLDYAKAARNACRAASQ